MNAPPSIAFRTSSCNWEVEAYKYLAAWVLHGVKPRGSDHCLIYAYALTAEWWAQSSWKYLHWCINKPYWVSIVTKWSHSLPNNLSFSAKSSAKFNVFLPQSGSLLGNWTLWLGQHKEYLGHRDVCIMNPSFALQLFPTKVWWEGS